MSAPLHLSSREMLDRLIAFDTVSSRSNLELIAFVEDYLASHGVSSRRVENEDGRKASLFATLGPADAPGGIVLSGHTDVVPVEGQTWTSDPFVATEKDGKLYGRGTSDMKSFIAIALAAVPQFLSAKPKLPIHFALSYDEEVGCIGVRPMIDQVIRTLPKPQVVVVGEPTQMKVVDAHKEIHAFETVVTGLEAHSSAPHLGVNAVMIAARVIGELDRLAAEMRQKGDASKRFVPPYTTINVGTIRGGVQLNIIPKSCRFEWEFRGLPDQDPDEIPDRLEAFVERDLRPQMKAVHPDADVVTRRHHHVPGLAPADSEGETLIMRLAEQNGLDAASYGTEAGLFQLADIPTVVCGPGSIEQAHKPDEWIALDQLAACEAFMGRLAAYVGNPA